VLLGWLDWALASRPHRGQSISFGLRGREDKGFRLIGPKQGPEDLPGLGPDGDSPLDPVMLHLVAIGHIPPSLTGHVHVDCPDRANLTGPHGGEPLEFHHRPDLAT